MEDEGIAPNAHSSSSWYLYMGWKSRQYTMFQYSVQARLSACITFQLRQLSPGVEFTAKTLNNRQREVGLQVKKEDGGFNRRVSFAPCLLKGTVSQDYWSLVFSSNIIIRASVGAVSDLQIEKNCLTTCPFFLYCNPSPTSLNKLNTLIGLDW